MSHRPQKGLGSRLKQSALLHPLLSLFLPVFLFFSTPIYLSACPISPDSNPNPPHPCLAFPLLQGSGECLCTPLRSLEHMPPLTEGSHSILVKANAQGQSVGCSPHAQALGFPCRALLHPYRGPLSSWGSWVQGGRSVSAVVYVILSRSNKVFTVVQTHFGLTADSKTV